MVSRLSFAATGINFMGGFLWSMAGICGRRFFCSQTLPDGWRGDFPQHLTFTLLYFVLQTFQRGLPPPCFPSSQHSDFRYGGLWHPGERIVFVFFTFLGSDLEEGQGQQMVVVCREGDCHVHSCHGQQQGILLGSILKSARGVEWCALHEGGND
jgi:hypothetical protein